MLTAFLCVLFFSLGALAMFFWVAAGMYQAQQNDRLVMAVKIKKTGKWSTVVTSRGAAEDFVCDYLDDDPGIHDSLK